MTDVDYQQLLLEEIETSPTLLDVGFGNGNGTNDGIQEGGGEGGGEGGRRRVGRL